MEFDIEKPGGKRQVSAQIQAALFFSVLMRPECFIVRFFKNIFNVSIERKNKVKNIPPWGEL